MKKKLILALTGIGAVLALAASAAAIVRRRRGRCSGK